MIYFSAFFLLLISLGPKFTSVDPKLQPYFDEVKELSNGNLSGIKRAGFEEDDDKILASCYYNIEEIRVNPKNWEKLNHKDRLLTIAHEVGHCIKKCKHIDGVDYWGCAKHFMYYQDTGKWCNRINWDQYVKQMKNLDCGK